MKSTIVIAVVASALSVAPAMAQSSSHHTKHAASKSASTAGTISARDRAFEKEAASGGMAEVELGTLAKEKAANADVKQFADRMVTDHGKLNDELKQWAQQKNVTLPTELDAASKTTKGRLSKLSGEAFDRAYMHDMVADHVKDVAAFKHASKTAKDPDLKSWATKTLPTLEEHLKLARETSSKLSPTTSHTKSHGRKDK